MKIKGKIENKESKEGSTKGKDWKRIVFTVNGKKYSSFDTRFEGFKIGQLVELEVESNGKYNNIKSMEEATGNPGPEVDWDAKDKRNAKMNGVNNAVRILEITGFHGTKEQALKEITEMADSLLDYIYK